MSTQQIRSAYNNMVWTYTYCREKNEKLNCGTHSSQFTFRILYFLLKIGLIIFRCNIFWKLYNSVGACFCFSRARLILTPTTVFHTFLYWWLLIKHRNQRGSTYTMLRFWTTIKGWHSNLFSIFESFSWNKNSFTLFLLYFRFFKDFFKIL